MRVGEGEVEMGGEARVEFSLACQQMLFEPISPLRSMVKSVEKLIPFFSSLPTFGFALWLSLL